MGAQDLLLRVGGLCRCCADRKGLGNANTIHRAKGTTAATDYATCVYLAGTSAIHAVHALCRVMGTLAGAIGAAALTAL
jgi:hypothetical protein